MDWFGRRWRVLVLLAGLTGDRAWAQRSELMPVAPMPEATAAARWVAQETPPPGFLVHEKPDAGVTADGSPPMTLAELEAIALERNPTLQQAAMQVEAFRGEYLQAGLHPNPVIGYQAEEIGDQGTAGQQGGFVEQEIVTAGKLGLRRRVAGHAVAEAQSLLAAQRQRVLNDVRSGYYDVLAAQRVVEVSEEIVRIQEKGAETTRQLLEAKEVSRVDLLQANVEAESARLKRSTARNRLEAAWRRLTAVLGAPGMPMPRLDAVRESDMAQLEWQESFDRLLSSSPELAAAKARVDRARCEVARQCADRVPNVGVLGAVRYDNAEQQTLASVQVGMPLPVFNRNQGNIYRAQSELVAAQAEVDRLELQLYNRLAEAFERYRNSQTQITRYTSEILPSAQQAMELVAQGYRQGELSYLELLTSQRTFADVNLDYLESLQQFWTSTVAIEGMLLTGGLQTTLGSAN
ncbi:MAG: TolC family protein [Pirellulales bacterium]|nr:TolC family protein [Pirellulales bacterium]